MNPTKGLKCLAATLVAAFLLFGFFSPLRAAHALQAQKSATTPEPKENDVPAYHHHPPQGPLPETLSPDSFPSGSMPRKAYAMAAKIKAVLYQQPCYCYCDRDEQQHSLLDCYRTRHAAGCGICMAEAIYGFEQTRKGLTPAEIREKIIKGEWRQALSGQ